MSVLADIRIPSCSSVSWGAQGAEAGNTTGRWQDKRPHIARRSGGCFCKRFWRAPHIVAPMCNVRLTLKALYRHDLSHIAGSRRGR
jgi:hypothetical protein